MYSGVISRFVDDIREGRAPTIFGDGEQTRDFVFVKDVVQANLRAMTSEAAGHGEVFNVATGRQTSLLTLWNTLKGITGSNLVPTFKPPRPGDIKHSLADIDKIRNTLDYEPQYDLEKGLRLLLHATS